ncbi:hypothetical protein NL320_11025, partial [Klebsiella pneumoniae]|nr:hypothetical protein [Klebsiella pneumoniae]
KSAQIREILISESAWEEMTCLFAPSLTHSDSELSLYMGTIIPQNIPSMKTAERAGRTCILSYQFLPICRTHD